MEEKILEMLGNIQNQLVSHDNTLKEIQNKLADHDKRFDAVQNKLADHDKRFDAVENKLADHDKRFDAVENKLEDHDRRFDHVEVKIEKEIKLLGDELHTKIQVVNDNVEGLREDFNTMEMLTAKNTLDISKIKLAR